jgi:hypothetical protein
VLSIVLDQKVNNISLPFKASGWMVLFVPVFGIFSSKLSFYLPQCLPNHTTNKNTSVGFSWNFAVLVRFNHIWDSVRL